MKYAAIMLVAASLATAGSAAASTAASAIRTDTDYLRASRCKGIANGLGVDTTSLDALLKAERGSRNPVVIDMAKDELAKGERQTRDANLKERLSAELTGPCTAYMGGGSKQVIDR